MKKYILMILSVALLAACSAAGDNLASGNAAVVSVKAAAINTAAAVDLGNGSVRFEVTLKAGQQYVELFVRQNGAQNVARAIQGTFVDNYNGTYTYYSVVSGYKAGDCAEYRFYSFMPSSGGVFTPGPVENIWNSLVVNSAEVIPVLKDAAVIRDSYSYGYCADRNFGADQNVSAGYYHITSKGLFGFSLSALSGRQVAKAELVFRSTWGASGPGYISLGKVAAGAVWNENTVTWNNAPPAADFISVATPASGELRIDVTAMVNPAESEISFMMMPSAGNFFVDSKEATTGLSAQLQVVIR